MAHVFPSPEWVTAYGDAINASEGYRKAGREWTHGTVAMVVKADPALGIDEDMAMLLDVHEGRCRGTRLVGPGDYDDAPFVIVSDYPRWKSVLLREVDPTKAMMQGKLRLVKGHMPTMIKFVQASKELVEAASLVETTFRA